MTKAAGTLERLLLLAGESMEALAPWLEPDAFAEYLSSFGLRLPPTFFAGGFDTSRLSAAKAASDAVAPLLAPLRNALEETDSAANALAVAAAGASLGAQVGATLQALRGLGQALLAAAPGIAETALRQRLEQLATDLPRRLAERHTLDRLTRSHRDIASFLQVLGLAEDGIVASAPGDLSQPAFHLQRLHPEALVRLLSKPLEHLQELYGWGDPGFDGTLVLGRIAQWLEARGREVAIANEFDLPPVTPPGLDFGPVRLQADPSTSPPGFSVEWRKGVSADYDRETTLGAGPWQFYATSSSHIEGGVRVTLTPDGKLAAAAFGSPVLSARAGLRVEAADDNPVTLLGIAGGTRVEAKKIDISVGVEGLQSSPFIAFKQEGLNCVLDVGGGDSFLKSISGGGRGKTDITLGATWTPGKGLKFDGSAALEIAIPAHVRLGPATIETIYLVARIEDGKIPIEISAALRGELGPFTAVVDGVGVAFKATFPKDGGNLGPLQLDAGFKAPNGLGLSMDGGGFSGGGFLKRDPVSGEYAGALELVFQDVIQVKAFGVLDTRMPDGSEGYSLVIVINAEFAPIQLSFGFTLNGVGGLLGVNRTALYDQLRAGLRDGSINSILFPKNLIANAPRIIGDLKRMFPPQSGRYLIGPMAKLGWGTPPLVTLELGIILEIPRPGVAILGVLRVAVPADDIAILNLQVNFLGVIDFERKELSIDASLFDSRLLAFTLTGDMAVRLYWGENANFLLTAGGFHPDFTPPPLALPQLNRLAISMWAGNPRLSAEAYFAVTSNTVQFGAKVELYYGVKVFNVYGFVSLDALIRFDPFHFIAEISGQVAVRSGGSTLFSIRLELLLEGPTPWHARGRGSFEIGFIFTVTISAGFEITFGEDRDTSLPPVQARGLLETALRADGAWRALAPARAHVSVRELAPGSGIVIAPIGALSVSQKIAPLGLPLARIGAQRVEGPNTFRIVDVSLGAGVEPPTSVPVLEQFPAAQFLELSDAERLSRRSFEPFDAGIEIAGGASPRADFQTHVEVAYEVIYVRKPRRPLFFYLRDTLTNFLVAGSAAGRSKLSAERRAPTGLATPPVKLPEERFVVAGVDDLRPHAPHLVFTSQSAAALALKDVVRKDARLTGKLQVVSSFEAAA
ncbi:MAG: hypothetical protein QM773_00865 [Hyphomonadaceae bacterium]